MSTGPPPLPGWTQPSFTFDRHCLHCLAIMLHKSSFLYCETVGCPLNYQRALEYRCYDEPVNWKRDRLRMLAVVDQHWASLADKAKEGEDEQQLEQALVSRAATYVLELCS